MQKINIITVLNWVVSHWSEISKILKRVIELVLDNQNNNSSGFAKRFAVLGVILKEFPELENSKSLINTVIELVVAILKWKKIIE